MLSLKGDNLLEMATNFAIPAEEKNASATLSWLQIFLDVSHMIMCCIQVRNDCPDIGYSRRFPLATFAASVLSCLAGGILSNLLLGLPLVADLTHGSFNLVLLVMSWYMVFYSPFDLCNRIFTSTFGLRLPLYVFKELGRARKISKGISVAHSLYPSCVPVMLIIGTVKGNGSAFVRPLILLIQGCTFYEKQVNEFLMPSFTTKATFLSCFVLVLGFQRGDKGFAGLGYPQLVFVISLLLVYAKVALTVLKLGDPIRPFENLLCRICFGRDFLETERINSLKKMGEDLSANSTMNQQNMGNVAQNVGQQTGQQLSRTSTMQSTMPRPKAE